MLEKTYFLKSLTAVSLSAISFKNIRPLGTKISSSQTGYPIAKSLGFSQN